jgi:UV excision repair protein RAD23
LPSQLDAEPSDTVADLKKKIEQEHGHQAPTQKLIYSGKDLFIFSPGIKTNYYAGQVLGDDKTVESCNIKEKGFLVLMISKPKAEPKSAAVPAAISSTSDATSAVPANVPTEAPAVAATASTPAAAAPQPPNAPILTPAQPAPVAQPAQSTRAINDENAFVTGAELQSTIQNMMEMGFERDQVMRALRASYNNPDRAVEYLFSVCIFRNCLPRDFDPTSLGYPGTFGRSSARCTSACACGSCSYHWCSCCCRPSCCRRRTTTCGNPSRTAAPSTPCR